jgi:hypothetical protein
MRHTVDEDCHNKGLPRQRLGSGRQKSISPEDSGFQKSNALHRALQKRFTPSISLAWSHGPIIVLVMARVRQNGESSFINSVISNQSQLLPVHGGGGLGGRGRDARPRPVFAVVFRDPFQPQVPLHLLPAGEEVESFKNRGRSFYCSECPQPSTQDLYWTALSRKINVPLHFAPWKQVSLES